MLIFPGHACTSYLHSGVGVPCPPPLPSTTIAAGAGAHAQEPPCPKVMCYVQEVSRCHAGAEAALRHDICEALRADHSISYNHAAWVSATSLKCPAAS